MNGHKGKTKGIIALSTQKQRCPFTGTEQSSESLFLSFRDPSSFVFFLYQSAKLLSHFIKTDNNNKNKESINKHTHVTFLSK